MKSVKLHETKSQESLMSSSAWVRVCQSGAGVSEALFGVTVYALIQRSSMAQCLSAMYCLANEPAPQQLRVAVLLWALGKPSSQALPTLCANARHARNVSPARLALWSKSYRS